MQQKIRTKYIYPSKGWRYDFGRSPDEFFISQLTQYLRLRNNRIDYLAVREGRYIPKHMVDSW